MAEMKIIWDTEAKISFRKLLIHIKKDSLQAAEKVKFEILGIIKNIPDHPEIFPSDKFKIDNDGSIRAFEKYSFRIVYQITLHHIRILRVRHVKQEPKEY
ncbi:type II toxin-antitoxin system RelE/ParE family toxin [Aquiflexum sp.]|uniref:type II toxin-antitoxin system RelE/ParE family toxin n=1 Tax=Aquiflexum sp. TaxID=1872584 RepID=UPI003592E8DD